ncbi:hypothetical protein KOR42_39580 [Thalassoglobus neptunius]|uniref:Uncharacterized protein n=1 Tax=Thalassoglobus neptunius TaxID=1938619 RepID=A0A5C5WGX1_9PLAN|nr:hypothetical protein [Thalassoglobus neptunius]TWT49042.1 hypothetical protein KOR42_39580 [Thalassoglobus neptunius]
MILNEQTEFYETDSFDLIRFAKAYQDLGEAVTEQLDDLFEQRYDEVNPNAIELIRQELGGMNEEIDSVLEEFAHRRTH